MNKQNVACTYNRIAFSLGKEEDSDIWNNLDELFVCGVGIEPKA